MLNEVKGALPRQQALLKQQDGFALVAAMLIVAVMSVAAIPLLNLVGGTQESNVKNQVTSFLNVEARENLELAVYLAKAGGGMPIYSISTHTPQSLDLARSCERRVNNADPNLIGAGNSLVDLTNTVYLPISAVNQRETISFVVNKGKAATQNDSGDDRYHRYLIVSCAIATGYGMALYTSEIANIQGSVYTLNLNEY